MLEALGAFFSTPWMWITYLCIGLLHLYIWYVLDALITYGTFSLAFTRAFWGIWEDFIFNLPGGMKRKETAVRAIVTSSSHGSLVGNKSKWNYSHVRARENYREVARDMYMSAVEFWLLHVGFVFVLWPVALAVAIVLLLIVILSPKKKTSGKNF